MRTKDESKFGRRGSHGQGYLLWLEAFLKDTPKKGKNKHHCVCGWNIFTRHSSYFKILLKGKSDQIYKNFLQLKKKLKYRTFFLCEYKTLRSHQYSCIVTYLHVKVLWCSLTTSKEKFTMPESTSSQAF